MEQSVSCADERILLALYSQKTIRKHNLTLVSRILNAGYELVIIAFRQPASTLNSFYEQRGIDTSHISYVDTVTKYSLGAKPEMPRTRFVAQPGDLTGIGIALTEMLKPKFATSIKYLRLWRNRI